MDPTKVISPQASLQLIRVLLNGTLTGKYWSLAIGLWDGNTVMLKRWDGDGPDNKGHPISSGYAVWFVEPSDDGHYDWIVNHSGWVSEADRPFAREFLGLK